MTLTAGIKLGPYEILSLIGQGGMGEVYRARDPRLARDVAVKVLPSTFSADPERLKRFEQEARAAGQLNHPNVVATYDVGVSEKTPYIVSELLEGEDLRALLASGPLPPRRAAEYVVEVANGLAAAHAKGIVHRDLKPENLHVLPGGHVKILDFGIAKLTRDFGGKADEAAQTLHSLTVTGEILGTASYMAPEQVRDQPTDHRTDIFALGAILYELLTGKKAFPGATAADRISAILNVEPPDLPPAVLDALPGVDEVIRRCLGKRPEERFDSARDLAFTLGVLIASSSDAKRAAGSAAGPRDSDSELAFRRLTFREGDISAARFSPDGQTVVYSAAWDGRPSEVFVTRLDSPETREVGLKDANLLAVGPSGDIAVQLRPKDLGGFVTVGTLARIPLMGGRPRELLDGVIAADWGPDGQSFAVLRESEGAMRLEFPVGKTLHQTAGWLSFPRVSRDGRRVAFLSHPTRGDNAGDLMDVDLDGKARRLAGPFDTAWGASWSPDGTTVWISAIRGAGTPGIFAVGLDGSVRPAHHSAGYVGIEDISRSGDALLLRINPRMRAEYGAKGSSGSVELSWFDWSLVRDISPDGKQILFDETGLGAAGGGSVYMRATDASPAVYLGEGKAMSFSPDGRWVLASPKREKTALLLLPVGAGESVLLPTGGIHVHYANWFPDGKHLCIGGNEPGRPNRLYRYNIERREAKAIAGEGVGRTVGDVSPDGRHVIAGAPAGGYALYSVDGGAPRLLDMLSPNERPVGWTADGSGLWILKRGMVPAPVDRLDLKSESRELWGEIVPQTRSGVDGINTVSLSSDGMHYAASYVQVLAELYGVRGLA
jgi:serine/threonine protein kinase/WD40 repeat protein